MASGSFWYNSNGLDHETIPWCRLSFTIYLAEIKEYISKISVIMA